MHDRPTAQELVSAARLFLESELLPTLTDARLRFQTLVTANVLAIVEREMQSEERDMTEEFQVLGKFLDRAAETPRTVGELKRAVHDMNEAVCRRIREGEFDDESRFHTLSEEVERLVRRKLSVANPKYLAGFDQGRS
jgi:hypothetical protein